MNINRFWQRSVQRFLKIFREIIRRSKKLISPGRVLLAKADAQGKGLQIDLAIDFYEAILGCQKKIRFKHWKTLANGRMRLTTKTTIVEIPPGVEYGTRLPLTGVDVSVDRQAPRDLYVFISAPLSQDNFRRDGNDLLSIVQITQKQADRGAKINVDTIDGIDRLIVPLGTQSGSYVTLLGRGVCKMGSPGERGNHLFRLVVESSHPDRSPKLPALNNQTQSKSSQQRPSSSNLHSDLKILLEELIERGWAKDEGSAQIAKKGLIIRPIVPLGTQPLSQEIFNSFTLCCIHANLNLVKRGLAEISYC
ncbi:J domain-containing protein [Chamaesiphon sp. GL140_3_metabinner_50]|uniref:J domain-containing protein n=1 Tax=Chamaesiphon sp. GL140_3_metabinner_50 TaxID=2970812 RepID=UPI0025D50B12|nr:J domain-containing protein [Chamaesiphon sp. GL140_3_metabinner_50]